MMINIKLGSGALRPLLCAAAMLTACPVQAQGAAEAWPQRPVTLIVPFSPGATVDIETRLYGNRLAQLTGGSFVVDFKPGAGTLIGLGYVAKSRPDGHVLGAMTPTVTIARLTLPDSNFDPLKDLAPISLMSIRPVIFLVHPSLPVGTLKEFIAYAKANPGKVNVGTSGAGGLAELGWGWFNSITGIKTTLVHYKGGAPALAAILAGEVHMFLGGFSTATGPIKSGRLKALAISTPERSKKMPDLPTVSEQGVPFDYVQWIGIAAPGGTPPALIRRISAELAKVAKTPEVEAKLEFDGTILVGSTPERFRDIVTEEISRWTRVAKETGMKFSEQ